MGHGWAAGGSRVGTVTAVSWRRPSPRAGYDDDRPGAAGRRLRVLAFALFGLCALGLSVSVVGDVTSGELARARGGSAPAVPLALTATVVSAVAALAVTVAVLRATLSPRGVPSRATALLALAGVAYAPALLLGPGWSAWSAVLACFVLELLPWRPAVVLHGAGLLVQVGLSRAAGQSWDAAVFAGVSYAATSLLLFLVVRAVATHRDLERTRADLARAQVLAERARVSRDLHDLLGRDLAAISLKVELARRYQRAGRDGDVASGLEEVLALSHAAAGDLRALVTGYRTVTLRAELAAAERLLTDAGVRCEVHADAGLDLGGAEEAVAWVLREAATNVVKHARAGTCVVRVRAAADPGTVELVVENDGARTAAGSGASGGSGLAGARERVRALGGEVAAAAHAGTFRLVCRVPVAQPVEGRR